MLKISDLKSSMVDLRREEARIKKDLLKVTKQKQKIIKKQLENLFLESIKEFTWRIEIDDYIIRFFHDKDIINNSPLFLKNSINKKSIYRSVAKKAYIGVNTPSVAASRTDIKFYKTKFGKLLIFMEKEFDSAIIKYDKYHISVNQGGFDIPSPISFDNLNINEIEAALNDLNNFVNKTNIRLNLASFNAETELLESNLEIRKRFLNKNSNAFLFGL